MKILILAAGYGTRLYALVKDTPKPLLEVQGKALINYILDKTQGIDELNQVLVVTNDKFYNVFLEWAEQQRASFPVDIKVLNDGTLSPEDRLGSVGDMQFVLNQERFEDDLLVVGGDNLFDFSLKDYIVFARSKAPDVSIGVYDIGNIGEASKFGVVGADSNDKIVSFEEKPEKPKSSLIAMCFYYFPKESLGLVDEYLSQSKKSDKAGEYIKWLAQKNNVYAFKFTGKWYDIGSVESYQEAQENFKS